MDVVFMELYIINNVTLYTIFEVVKRHKDRPTIAKKSIMFVSR